MRLAKPQNCVIPLGAAGAGGHSDCRTRAGASRDLITACVSATARKRRTTSLTPSPPEHPVSATGFLQIYLSWFFPCSSGCLPVVQSFRAFRGCGVERGARFSSCCSSSPSSRTSHRRIGSQIRGASTTLPHLKTRRRGAQNPFLDKIGEGFSS